MIHRRRVDLEAILSFVVDMGEIDFDRLYPAKVVASRDPSLS